MIGKIRYSDGRNYICDDCNALHRFNTYEEAKAQAWAISWDRKACYCNRCAVNHLLINHNIKYTQIIIIQHIVLGL